MLKKTPTPPLPASALRSIQIFDIYQGICVNIACLMYIHIHICICFNTACRYPKGGRHRDHSKHTRFSKCTTPCAARRCAGWRDSTASPCSGRRCSAPSSEVASFFYESSEFGVQVGCSQLDSGSQLVCLTARARGL